jgi:hypothetical protein
MRRSTERNYQIADRVLRGLADAAELIRAVPLNKAETNKTANCFLLMFAPSLS